MDIKEQKTALRRRIKQQLKTLAPADSIFLYKTLAQFEAYEKARTVLVYASLPEEAPTQKLIERCLKDNKITALPRVAGKAMDFFILNPALPLRTQTHKGVFGISEPDPGLPLLSAEQAHTPILVFVPGLAFDKYGFRLGRGGGYYDRYFADFCGSLPDNDINNAVTLVGLCRNIQIVDKVPQEAHDLRVDFLMSEAGIQKTNRLQADSPR